MSSASSSKKINPTDDTDTETTENTSSASTITSPNEETKIIHWSQWDLTYESSRLISIGSSDLLVTKYTRAHHDRVSKIWFENKFVNEPENLDAFYDETIKKHEILTKKYLKRPVTISRKYIYKWRAILVLLKNGISSQTISTRAWQLLSFTIFPRFLILIITGKFLRNVITEH